MPILMTMPLAIPGYHKPIERVMIFVDGGYLRRTYQDTFGDDKIDFLKLVRGLVNLYDDNPFNIFRADLIRWHYYDAIVPEEERERSEQQRFFDSVYRSFSATLRLGELVKSSKRGPRQKGVDIRMAIDALSKAYMNQYDSAIFLLGDRDFIPLIEAVKDSGKKTYGFYFGTLESEGKVRSKVSSKLCKTFDFRVVLTKEILAQWRSE